MSRWLSGQVRFILLAFVLLALSGSASALRLPVSLFPHIDFPRVVVALDAGDRPVDQMVNQVMALQQEGANVAAGDLATDILERRQRMIEHTAAAGMKGWR